MPLDFFAQRIEVGAWFPVVRRLNDWPLLLTTHRSSPLASERNATCEPSGEMVPESAARVRPLDAQVDVVPVDLVGRRLRAPSATGFWSETTCTE